MQMFNGFTMWILRNYRINLDNGPEATGNDPESNEALQGQNLQKIYEEINELNDGDKTDNDKIEIKWILTKEFSNYLEKNPKVATELLNAVNNLNFDNITDENVKNENEGIKTDLQIFLKPILESVTINNQMNADSINGDEGELYEKKGLTQEALNNIKSKIDWLISSLWAQTEDENKKKTIYRNTLNNIKKVIEYPNSENTKALQKFILANLKDKTDFLKGNFKGWDEEKPDGLFGQATLNWVDAFLGVLKTSIDNIINAEQVMDKNKPANVPSVVADWDPDNSFVVTDWDPSKVPETLEKPKAPTYPINGTLDGVVKWTDEQRETWLKSQLQRERPEEGEAEAPEWKRLYETIEHLSDLIWKIDDKYAKIEWIKDNITSLKTNLVNIQYVINNTTEDNVRKLQNFIAANLDDKTAFDKASKKNETYDGMFWKGTLAWLNAVLKKVKDYFGEVDGYLKNMEEYNNNQVDKITWKSDVKKWETDAKNLVDNLPDGATVDFKNDEEKEKLNKTGEQNIELVVKLQDGTEKEITVKVTVVESADHSDNPPTSTTPLKMKEGNTEKTYQVVENSSTIASYANVPWATFYLATDYQPKQPAEGQDRECQSVPEWENDYPCIMKLWDNLYKVDICNWYLCPVATKLVKKSNGDYEEDKWWVLFMNNSSCINYLKAKMFNIQNDYEIWWNSRYNDYYLKSYWRALTIEPMTIAWDWISRKEKDNPDYLSKNLAFLNLTNYIRWEWDEHNKPDPDVNRKVDKFKRIKDGKNKLGIDRNRFWLSSATEQELAKFKRYNNWEQWEDDWDKKRKNKVYQKIKLG